jgi:hypothetical protein
MLLTPTENLLKTVEAKRLEWSMTDLVSKLMRSVFRGVPLQPSRN